MFYYYILVRRPALEFPSVVWGGDDEFHARDEYERQLTWTPNAGAWVMLVEMQRGELLKDNREKGIEIW